MTDPTAPAGAWYLDVTTAAAREVLLGRRGPYADPRYAVGPLDDLAHWVSLLDGDHRRDLGRSLLALLGDEDPVVRTGAALGLDPVLECLEGRELLEAVDRVDGVDERLAVPPVGFPGADGPTVRAEVLRRAARRSRPGDELRWTSLLGTRLSDAERASVLPAVTRHLPDLLA